MQAYDNTTLLLPNLETPVQRADDDVSSLIARISPWRVLRRGATAGSTSSADPGNKNDTHSHTVADFFRENKWVSKGMNSVQFTHNY